MTLQQPRPAPTPAGGQARASSIADLLPRNQPATTYDSTIAHISLVGVRVSEVRSGLEVYRRAVFNDADDAVMQRSDLLRRRCQAVADAAQDAARRMCRTCTAAQLRGPIENYRAVLPQVASMGRQCATSIAGLSRGPQTTAAPALRREVRNIGNRINQALVAYEARLEVVRRALGAGPAAVQVAPQPPAARQAPPARPRP